MRITQVIAAIAWTVVTTPMAAQTAVTLDAVARAMGGKDRILAVRTVTLEGTGETVNFGQNHTPYADNRFELTSYRAVVDYVNRRWFADETRVPRFAAANTAPQRQRIGLDGAPNGVAYNVTARGVMQRSPAQVAADRMHEFVLYPIGFVMAAYRPGSDVSVEDASNNQARIRINPDGIKYAMYVDRRTMLPTRIERISYHPMLGDVPLWLDMADWTDVEGLKLPKRFTRRLGDRWLLNEIRLTRTGINEDIPDIAATDSVRALTPSTPAAPNVMVQEIAPGVWSVAGQSHHTIAIEQSRGLVLVEAPQNEARALAALAKARELQPAKPIELVINTHHHFDHAGGLRAAMSQGLTIMTHQGNRDFYEKYVFPGRHFIQPDAQHRNPRPLRLITVSDRHVIADSLRPIEVFPIEGNAHSGSMLVVYLPAERLLIQADLYNPPAATAVNPVFPFAANLLENIQRRGLQVDRVVGVHGRPVPFSELHAAATRAP